MGIGLPKMFNLSLVTKCYDPYWTINPDIESSRRAIITVSS